MWRRACRLRWRACSPGQEGRRAAGWMRGQGMGKLPLRTRAGDWRGAGEALEGLRGPLEGLQRGGQRGRPGSARAARGAARRRWPGPLEVLPGPLEAPPGPLEALPAALGRCTAGGRCCPRPCLCLLLAVGVIAAVPEPAIRTNARTLVVALLVRFLSAPPSLLSCFSRSSHAPLRSLLVPGRQGQGCCALPRPASLHAAAPSPARPLTARHGAAHLPPSPLTRLASDVPCAAGMARGGDGESPDARRAGPRRCDGPVGKGGQGHGGQQASRLSLALRPARAKWRPEKAQGGPKRNSTPQARRQPHATKTRAARARARRPSPATTAAMLAGA